jgi:hypothetical protein
MYIGRASTHPDIESHRSKPVETFSPPFIMLYKVLGQFKVIFRVDSMLPKRGGGCEAFKSGEASMPGEQDDDYDGINSGWFGGRDGERTKPSMR